MAAQVSERDREMANDVLNRSGEEQADLDLVEIIAAALAQARAEEREEIANRASQDVVRDQRELLQRMIDRAVAEEREACAKVADREAISGTRIGTALSIAAAIRARGGGEMTTVASRVGST